MLYVCVLDNVRTRLIGLQDLPIAMQAPAFSLDYFPSADVAWSLFESQKIKVSTATPKDPRSAGPQDYFDRRVTTYGSAGSSNGPWERDTIPSGPQTPYSTGDTPPVVTPHSARSHRNSSVNSLSTSPEQTSNRSARRTNSNLSAAFSLSKAFTSLSTSPATQDRFKAAEADLSTSAPTAPTSSVTWGSTTFYSSNSSNSPEKRRLSTPRRRRSSTRSFGFDGAYDSEDEDDGYETDDSYYATAKVYTPAKKKPEERKIKVTLKNQNKFDTEGHASVPFMPPEDLPKRHAYREVYAEQLGAWGLYIQHAEVLKFNGMINYWNDSTPVYKLSSQMEKSATSTPAKNGTNSDSDVFATSNTQPPSGTRSPFGPLVPPGKMVRANSSISQVDSTNDSSQAPSRPMSDIGDLSTLKSGATWSHYTLPHPELELDAPRFGGRPKVGASGIKGSNCYICWERIQGLYVSCPTDRHKVHAKCYTEYVGGKSEEELLFKGVSCACSPPEDGDFKNVDLDSEWKTTD